MPNRVLTSFCVMCVTVVFATVASAGSIHPVDDDEDDLVPTGKGYGERKEINTPGKGHDKGEAGKGKPGTNISYHGGPVMLGTTNVYYIWYGNTWGGNTAKSILENLASHMGGSPYFNINTTYYNGANVHVSNSVAFKKSIDVPVGPYGTSLSDGEIQSIVSDAIASNQLPKDTSGVYFVLTSADVTASSGFCTQYCGWHTYGTIGGSSIKYSFVGNPDRCPSACAEQIGKSPNGNVGADGMASIIAHELEEAVTDPLLNAWYDRSGMENADKCAWTFGTTHVAGNGSLYNMTLGGSNYLIQRNWLNVGNGSCALAY